jgi:EH_Signature domain
MTTATPGSELLGALLILTATVRELQSDVQQPLPQAPLAQLQEVAKALDHAKTPRPRRCPQRYRRQWQQVLAGERKSLDPAAVPYLCWEPVIATDLRFHRYLDRQRLILGVPALQGLVHSCHARWSQALAAGSVARAVQRQLARYQGMHRLLQRWAGAAAMLMTPQGPQAFADELLGHLRPVAEHCTMWGVDEWSPYVVETVRQALRRCRERMAQHGPLRQFLFAELLTWSGWPLEDFQTEVAATILHPASAAMREALLAFVLREPRLGDPRLPSSVQNWQDMPEESCRRVTEWLSQADIMLFFDLLVPHSAAPHVCKAFWLRYVPHLLRSRPLLSRGETARLQPQMTRRREHSQSCGRLDGTTSALLLDFGALLIIEFSQPGLPCYIYERGTMERVVADFWTPQAFTLRQLQQDQLCLASLTHREGWQDDMAEILEHYGILAR